MGLGFGVVSVLAVTGAVPRGPLGEWSTPVWADLLLLPFAGPVVLVLALCFTLGLVTGRLSGERATLAARVIAALVVLSVIEAAFKGLFPSTAGRIGPASLGPLEFGFYPSGHSARSALVCTVGFWLLPASTAWRYLLLAIPPLVGVALVAAGGHFPIDVAGGILLGSGLGLLAVSPRHLGLAGGSGAGRYASGTRGTGRRGPATDAVHPERTT